MPQLAAEPRVPSHAVSDTTTPEPAGPRPATGADAPAAPDFTHAVTDRLDLRAVGPGDLADLFAIVSDPRTWEHDPAGRHRVPETTKRWIERAEAKWRTDGLSYWMARLAQPSPGSQNQVIGVGGVQRHTSGTWNVFYRLAPSAWGQGYATELGRTAIDAAHRVDPDVPVIAWIVDHNLPSRRVAVRLGLVDRGLRLDANDGVVRRAYSDRPLQLPDENPVTPPS
jgi:RimJ/RimL family protein N-acetyltransferase